MKPPIADSAGWVGVQFCLSEAPAPTSPSGKGFSRGHLLTGPHGSEEVVLGNMKVFLGENGSSSDTGRFEATPGLKSEHDCSPRESYPGLPQWVLPTGCPCRNWVESSVLNSLSGCVPLTGCSLCVCGCCGRNCWKIQGRVRRLKNNLRQFFIAWLSQVLLHPHSPLKRVCLNFCGFPLQPLLPFFL